MSGQKRPFVVMYTLDEKNNNSSGFQKIETLNQLYEFLTYFGYKLVINCSNRISPSQTINGNQSTITFSEIISTIRSLPHFKIYQHQSSKKGSALKSISMKILKGYRYYIKERAMEALDASQEMLQFANNQNNIQEEILKIMALNHANKEEGQKNSM